jgi:hypothetical protein
MNKTWKMEVFVDNSWSSNACVYATKEEAEAAGQELLNRWFVPTDSRAAESTDPVNYRFNFVTYRPERIDTAS